MTPDLSRALWFKSSYSAENGSNCLEIADLADRIGVRDSKDTGLAPLLLPKSAWRSFLRTLP
jgi:hypothetical protein